MNVYEITRSLEEKYHGCGLALAAIGQDGQLIDFKYLRDIDEDFDEDLSPKEAAAQIAENERFKAFGQFFEVPGHSRMAFGMLSSWQFCEL